MFLIHKQKIIDKFQNQAQRLYLILFLTGEPWIGVRGVLSIIPSLRRLGISIFWKSLVKKLLPNCKLFVLEKEFYLGCTHRCSFLDYMDLNFGLLVFEDLAIFKESSHFDKWSLL